MYLNCHSVYSLNYGVIKIEAMLQNAESLGVRRMALTDINNTSGCLDFIRLARNHGIKPVIGIDFRQNTEQLYTGLAKNNEGFKELNGFLSHYRTQHKEIPVQAPSLPNCFIIYPWKKDISIPLKENEYLGLRPADIAAFRLYGKKHLQSKLVVLAPATFKNKTDFNTHRLLRAIYHNTLLSKLPVTEQGNETDKMLPLTELMDLYAEFPEAIRNTDEILKECRVDFEFGKSKNKQFFNATKEEDIAMLEKLATEGLHYRYKNPDTVIIQRFKTEMETINTLGFTAYFLINWDIVRYAQERNFFYIGRGSGANSLIAYCLRITDVDPVELDLYFERFINSSRRNPPDFDIDFSHTDRDAIRQYIFDKYPGHAALVGSYNTFVNKSCIREIGKV
ncbi:MAG: polymerase subunit alpha, partial [Bacteroidota bacterium]|nr:polymerase subunit alpha [Bacteroidota bacterium]